MEKEIKNKLIKIDSHFSDYIISDEDNSLHPHMLNVYKKFPNSLQELKNLIFYGPCGIGKYTQVLNSIKKYSNSQLKYEKKLNILFNKNNYYIKISDIHYEIDMSILKSNSKLLWNELYSQIIDIIKTKNDKSGIILCKNFNNINNEFLDIFYSYMQECIYGVKIVFIIITENISFINCNIINRCQVIALRRPSKELYKKCFGNNFTCYYGKEGNDISNIINIKNILNNTIELMTPHNILCNSIIKSIIEIDNLNFQKLRNNLYDICIYNLDVSMCVWYILKSLIISNYIKEKNIYDVMTKLYYFLHYYNNNYRPIYHLESFIFYLINTIHGL